METVMSSFRQRATMKNALIALAFFLVVGFVLGKIDQPLTELAHGEGKLDFQIGYDTATVARLLNAYGAQGREIYFWDLVVDTLFPISYASVTILFVLLAARSLNELWQNFLVVPPFVFMILDLIENTIFFYFLQSYPSLSPSLVNTASLVTQVKRMTYSIVALELVSSAIIAVVIVLKNKFWSKRFAP